MRRTFLIALTLLVPIFPQQSNKAQRKPPERTTFSGCLDQHGQTYILSALKEMKSLATLKGVGFSDDNFARYVGHKVTLHGRMQREGEAATLHVTKIEDNGAGCEKPQ